MAGRKWVGALGPEIGETYIVRFRERLFGIGLGRVFVRDGSVPDVFYVIFLWGPMHNIIFRRNLPWFGVQVDAALQRAYAQ